MKYLLMPCLLFLTGCQMSVGEGYPDYYKLTITHKGETGTLRIKPGRFNKQPIVVEDGQWKIVIEGEKNETRNY